MKPTTLDIKRTGDLDGQKITMGIDESSFSHILSVLTNLYSDPQGAIIREYTCNARDAHIAAGKADVPIEVTTPNTFSSPFVVKDYGIGLDVADIENIYSKYGSSTKRGGNDQVGMLGLGCKSGLTYAPQFTVTAVKDGMKAIVTVSLVDEGHGVMEVVQHTPTDEANSVEISVPAKRGDNFNTACADFFRFWEPGTVLVNGKQPETISGNWIGKNLLVVDGLDKDYIVMGGVAYPVTGGLGGETNSYYKKWGVVGYVGIGEVNFTPSREELHYTGRTKAVVERLKQEFADNLISTIEADIAGAKTHSEAVDKFIVWQARFGQRVNGTTYKGAHIATKWQMPTVATGQLDAWGKPTSRQKPFIRFSNIRHVGLGSVVSKHNIVLEWLTVKDAVCIINYPFENLPVPRREKIRYYLDQNNLTPDVVLCFPSDVIGSPWTDGVHKVDYATVKALKPPRNSVKTASGYRFEVYDGLSSQGFADTNILDDSRDIVYFTTADQDAYSMRDKFSGVDIQVVKLSRNRWEKFNRDFPTGVEVKVWLTKKVGEAKALLTKDDKTYLWIVSQSYESPLKTMDVSKIDDPEIVNLVNIAHSGPSTAIKNYRAALKRWKKTSGEYDQAFAPSPNPLANYPLVTLGNWFKVSADVYLYLNAKYVLTRAKKPAKVHP